ncbi:hypothetical protein [Cutibacterium sp. V947]|uniref:hypothetical protein n=1 Tax=unclassified Cutibacterium TaxID=2649671 RepID=UPI003EE220BB
MADGQEGFWCSWHHTVEGADHCQAADRPGRYSNLQTAAEALETMEARDDVWDNDPQFNDLEDE